MNPTVTTRPLQDGKSMTVTVRGQRWAIIRHLDPDQANERGVSEVVQEWRALVAAQP